MTPGPRTAEFQLAVRASAAAGLSILIADLLSLPHPIFAFISAVLVTDLSPRVSRSLGRRRIVATFVGATVGVLLNPLLGGGPAPVALSILAAMVACQLAGASEGARVAGFVAGIIVLEGQPGSLFYAVDRIVETLLGVFVALAVSYAPKLMRDDETEK